MKHIKSIVSLLLALTLALSLTACGSQANTEPEQPDDTPTTAEVNLYVLSGPTGIGAMNLWAAADAGETENTYHVTMSGANDEVVAAISKGEADIAAVATNMAAALYNKTEGGVTVLAVNTLGVLSLLGNGQEAATIADLAGKTVVAEAGSAGETAISEDAGLSQAEYISKSVQTDCLMEVAAGTADAAVLDLTLATAMIGEGTDYANLAIKDELNAEEYGVAFRKGSDAAEAVNAAFDELKADGTMQTLADKYSLTLAD